MGGPILAQEELKTIFGSIPDIYDVHTRIKVPSVERVQPPRLQCVDQLLSLLNQGDLEELLTDWSEERSVGNIILKYVSTRTVGSQVSPLPWSQRRRVGA